MKPSKKKRGLTTALQNRLSELEEKAAHRGIHVHYDLLEAAGLKLKGGFCKIKSEYHLFIDKRKSATDKIEFLQHYIDHPLPEDIPENITADDPKKNKHDDE